MEAEKGAILAEKSVIEQEKEGLRDELIHLEQDKMNRESEKIGTIQISCFSFCCRHNFKAYQSNNLVLLLRSACPSYCD